MSRNCIDIQEKTECCGCGACASICPITCIEMKEDGEGFLYPHANRNACVGCGLCVRVCPMTKDNQLKGREPVRRAFVATNIDESIRQKSTSGGAFDALAKMVLAHDGLVVGARFDGDGTVAHDIAAEAHLVEDFYGSKYVQSNLVKHDIFGRVQHALDEGVEVLFSGTPCQVQALNCFLDLCGCKKENLVSCDFVCRAVPSPGVWRIYLREMEEHFGSRAQAIAFRNKTYGYHSSTMKIVFENGATYLGSGRVDPMHKAFFEDVISRPCCYECPFRFEDRSSDFTLFDCWRFESHTGEPDDDRGHTHLWLHTKRADGLLAQIQEGIDLIEVDKKKVVSNDGIMAVRNPQPNGAREAFLSCVFDRGLSEAVRHFIPITPLDYAIERSKALLYRLHIIKLGRKVVGR